MMSLATVRAALAHELSDLHRRASLLEHLSAALEEVQSEAELGVLFEWLAPAGLGARDALGGETPSPRGQSRVVPPAPPGGQVQTRRMRARRGTMSQRIEAAIGRSRTGLAATEIARRVDRDLPVIFKALQVLVRQRRIHLHGRYYCSGPAPAPSVAPALLSEAAPSAMPSARGSAVRDVAAEYEIVPLPRVSANCGSSLNPSTLLKG